MFHLAETNIGVVQNLFSMKIVKLTGYFLKIAIC